MHPDVIISPWDNPQNIETLRTMFAEGASASEIARALGNGISRNAVIGKIVRLKLTREPRVRVAVKREENIGNRGRAGNPGQAKAKSIVARAATRERARMRADVQHSGNEVFREGRLPPEDGVDVTALVGLVDLKHDSCRWPHGDPLEPGFGFCGQTAKEGSSYCPAHHARAFKKAGAE